MTRSAQSPSTVLCGSTVICGVRTSLSATGGLVKSSIGKIRGGSCAIGNFTRCATFVWHIQKAYVLCGRTRSSRPRRRLNSRHQRHCYITIQHSSRNFRIQLPGRHDAEFDQLPQCRYGAPTPRYLGTHTVDPGLHPTPGVSTPHHPRLLKSSMSWTVRRTPIRGKPERFGRYRHCLDFRLAVLPFTSRKSNHCLVELP